MKQMPKIIIIPNIFGFLLAIITDEMINEPNSKKSKVYAVDFFRIIVSYIPNTIIIKKIIKFSNFLFVDEII